MQYIADLHLHLHSKYSRAVSKDMVLPVMDALLKTPIGNLEKYHAKIAEGVEKARKGDIVIDPGYDGEYGKVKI